MTIAGRKTRVLVVDDSAIARRVLTATLRKDPDVEVVAEASDAFAANTLVAQQRPDVVTLDLDMPQMDGLAFLQHLMRHHRMPVVIVSGSENSPATAEALRLGAVDVILKPQSPAAIEAFGRRLHQRMRELRESSFQINPRPNGRDHGASAPPPARQPQLRAVSRSFDALIAIGASVGGPEAIETVLAHLPSDSPPVVIVQHMPASFTKQFAKRLDQACAMHVVEAEDRQEIARGGAYLAPGDYHMTVERQQGRLRAMLRRGAAFNHQRPSVDVMFQSLARLTGVPIVGVLLTGMGDDGADGMVALSEAGHETIAEHEQTCVVFGMPGQAIARGGADARRSTAADRGDDCRVPGPPRKPGAPRRASARSAWRAGGGTGLGRRPMIEWVAAALGQTVLLLVAARLVWALSRYLALKADPSGQPLPREAGGPPLFYDWRPEATSPSSGDSRDRADRSDAAPRIVPVRFGHRDFPWATGEQGLYVENRGRPASNLVALPVRIGHSVVSFAAAENGELGGNRPVSYFRAVVEGPAHGGEQSFADAFCDWQNHGIRREAVGTITFSDADGRLFQTIYRITLDILNADSGLAVELVEQRRIDKPADDSPALGDAASVRLAGHVRAVFFVLAERFEQIGVWKQFLR